MKRFGSDALLRMARALTLALAMFSLTFSQMPLEAIAETLDANASPAIQAAEPDDDSARIASEPALASNLTYTGAAQRGVEEGEGYTLTGTVEACYAGTYVAVATPDDGYTWEDGTTDPKEIAWTISKAALTATYAGETIEEGATPALALDLTGFVGGETAASVARDDPTFAMPTLSADDLSVGEHVLTPKGGSAKNYTFAFVAGTLTVKSKTPSKTLAPGTYSITANLKMPGAYNPVLSGVTVYPTSPNNPFTNSDGTGPVIDENTDVEVKSAVPMSPASDNAKLIVAEDGTKTLVLPVRNPVFTLQNLGTCSKLSQVWTETVAPANPSLWTYGGKETRIHKVGAVLTDGQTSGTATYDFKGSSLYAVPLSLDIAPSGDIALQLDVDYDSATFVSSSTEVDFKNPNQPEKPGDTKPSEPSNPSQPTNPTQPSDPSTPAEQPESQPSQSGKFKAGTYKVSANIWFDRATTGLPLNPHITSGVFPPKDPVSNNATLVVDESGHATLTVPISIQHKVMYVKSIAGLNVISTSWSDNGISSITLDLGVLSASDTVIRRSCTVSVYVGDLAMQIGGAIFGSRDHTWSATFQMNVSGVPASGGGAVPAAALAVMNGEKTQAQVTEEQREAEEAAIAKAEAANEASRAASRKSDKGLAAVAEEISENPSLAAGAAVAAIALVAAVIVVVRKHRVSSKEA